MLNINRLFNGVFYDYIFMVNIIIIYRLNNQYNSKHWSRHRAFNFFLFYENMSYGREYRDPVIRLIFRYTNSRVRFHG